MKRYVDLSQVSDGKLYTAGDMVRVGCNDCEGCSACCHNMGNTIVLDPYDIYNLIKGLGISMDGLMQEIAEYNVADGIILPNLAMSGKEDKCYFLSKEGRCSIHEFRPGICRIFPLGRIYDDGGYKYFNQIHECKKGSRSKVKIKNWIGVPEYDKYEKFIWDWHFFLNSLSEIITESGDETMARNASMAVLNIFYRKEYDVNSDFYGQFYSRLEYMKTSLGM